MFLGTPSGSTAHSVKCLRTASPFAAGQISLVNYLSGVCSEKGEADILSTMVAWWVMLNLLGVWLGDHLAHFLHWETCFQPVMIPPSFPECRPLPDTAGRVTRWSRGEHANSVSLILLQSFGTERWQG